ncbi:NUDIX hydrolase [Candidatus Kaiserbacteria bacterium]|nr:NUDIX hydrolase [Candidatus Kaiserbacteria bacterium]
MAIARGPDRGAVMTCVLSPTRILLVKEAHRSGAMWKLPGGSVSQGESIIEAARREVLEEAGLELSGLTLHSVEQRGAAYRPFLCIACVSEEKLNEHALVGDEDGQPTIVATFGHEAVRLMKDVLEPHRVLIDEAMRWCGTRALKSAG